MNRLYTTSRAHNVTEKTYYVIGESQVHAAQGKRHPTDPYSCINLSSVQSGPLRTLHISSCMLNAFISLQNADREPPQLYKTCRSPGNICRVYMPDDRRQHTFGSAACRGQLVRCLSRTPFPGAPSLHGNNGNAHATINWAQGVHQPHDNACSSHRCGCESRTLKYGVQLCRGVQ